MEKTSKTANPLSDLFDLFDWMFHVVGYAHQFKRHDHLVYEYGIRLLFLLKASFIHALRVVYCTERFTTQTDISLFIITKHYV